ncbi:Alkaline phosphatase synthesis sensor protein PhoR [bacterium HR33]|nr:Alkaline phosphatase synthesis sensor protein PhoR [bacterium HR33]
MNLVTRFTVGAALFGGAAAASLSLAGGALVRATLEQRLMDELIREASLVAAALSEAQGEAPNALAHRYGRILKRRVTLIDPAGTVIGDSEFDDTALPLLENHGDRPEVRDAINRGSGNAKRYSESTGRVEFKAAVRSGNLVVRISAAAAELDPALDRADRLIFLAASATVLLGILVARRTARSLRSELDRLEDAARAPAPEQGPALTLSSIPEVAEVATALEAARSDTLRLTEELRRERDAWESVLESLTDGVLAFDAEGSVRIANSAARRLLGYSPAQPIPALFELFRQREMREVVERLQAGAESAEAEVTLGEKTLVLSGRMLPAGGTVLFLKDITDLRRLEAVRRDFVANVSHELKTPLTIISGYAETLLAEEDYIPQQRQFLETILQNARRMRRLVDDLLDLAQLESQQVKLARQPLDPAAAAREAFEMFRDRAERKGLSFEVQVPEDCLVSADPDAFRRILVNLFDNALRHTPAGGRIAVLAREEKEAVEVAVADTGTGIPREHLHRVFERFYRVDAGRSRAEGGTGLGLSIVKHLVEAHGGSVRIESYVGRGTTVWLRFPRAAG